MSKISQFSYTRSIGRNEIPNSTYTIKEPRYHNPDYLIVSTPVDRDSFITCCKPVDGGECKMEYYTGENYVLHSRKKSYGRIYSEDRIPKKYAQAYTDLKKFTVEWTNS